MPTSLPPTVPAARGAPGQRALTLALALLLLPLLAACSAPRGAGPYATIYAAEKTGSVSALDAANGKVLWRRHGGDVMGMAVDPNHHMLFLTSPEGSVTALDATTGKLDWQYAIGYASWLTKPYLVGSLVITATQQVPGTPARNSVIVALDARLGALLWRVSLPGAISGDLDIHTDWLYASVNTATGGAGDGGAVYALRTMDGAQVWHAASPATLVAGPVSDQAQVYAPTTFGSVFALRASDGALQWNQSISASGPLSALFANPTAIYVGDGDATVRALSKADGSVLWTRTIPNTTTVIGPLVYTPSDGGSLVLLTSGSTPIIDALSPSDGSVVWSQETLPEMSPPVVLGDYVYAALGDKFTILSLASGRYVAEYDVYLTSSGYTSAEQADLNDIAYIVVGPS